MLTVGKIRPDHHRRISHNSLADQGFAMPLLAPPAGMIRICACYKKRHKMPVIIRKMKGFARNRRNSWGARTPMIKPASKKAGYQHQ